MFDASTWMKELQLHHVTRLVSAGRNPLSVSRRTSGRNSSEMLAGLARPLIFFQRSGSLIMKRIRAVKMTGIRPQSITYRQARLGCVAPYAVVIILLTFTARNAP